MDEQPVRLVKETYLLSRLQRRRFPAVVFAALKGLNMTARGNALGTENGHESKP